MIGHTLFCVNLDPNPQQNDWNKAMSDNKSFWFSIDTSDDESIKLGNLKMIIYKMMKLKKCISSTIKKKISHAFK